MSQTENHDSDWDWEDEWPLCCTTDVRIIEKLEESIREAKELLKKQKEGN